MPDNTNAQVITFCNQQLRPACDRLESAIRTARQLVANYSAEGIGALVVGNDTLTNEYIGDGYEYDGRTPLLGYDVDLCVSKVTTLLAYLDSQSGMEAAIAKPAVNDAPVF